MWNVATRQLLSIKYLQITATGASNNKNVWFANFSQVNQENWPINDSIY